MKDSFRQSMAWLHTWLGLAAGWVLFFVFVTGTAGYFNSEITRWMKPELPVAGKDVAALTPARAFAAAELFLKREASGAEFWAVDVPTVDGGGALTSRPWFGGRDHRQLTVRWKLHGDEERHSAVVEGTTGDAAAPVSPRETAGGGTLYQMHYGLYYIPYDWGILLVGACTLLMMVAIVSGVITHKKIFVDFFTFRPAKGQRSWLDAHNLISVTALPFFVMITYSGFLLFIWDYMPVGMKAGFNGDGGAYHRTLEGDGVDERDAEPGPSGIAAPMLSLPTIAAKGQALLDVGQVTGIVIENPGDQNAVAELYRSNSPHLAGDEGPVLHLSAVTGERLADHAHHEPAVERVNVITKALHEGHFTGPLLRWFYFGSGLLGCAMIATGLVLWTVKRRQKQTKACNPDFGFRLVDVMNIGTIAGLPVGIAAYFWANRLLPVGMPLRAEWEVHAMFIAWGMMFVWAAIRAAGRAWTEELWIAALAFGLLPLRNALTTDKHLGVTIPAGDWVLAGFDLTVLALSLFFAVAAIKVGRKWTAATPAPRRRLVEATL